MSALEAKIHRSSFDPSSQLCTKSTNDKLVVEWVFKGIIAHLSVS